MSPHKVTELCLFVSVGLLHAAFLFFCAAVCVSKSVQCAYWVCSLHFCFLSMDRPNTEQHDTGLTSCLLYWPNIRITSHTKHALYDILTLDWGFIPAAHSHQYVTRMIMVRHIHLVFLLISTESSSNVVLLSLCLVLKTCSMWTVKAHQTSICYCFMRFVSWFALYRKGMKKGWGGRCYN